jgi:hypothetical protein
VVLKIELLFFKLLELLPKKLLSKIRIYEISQLCLKTAPMPSRTSIRHARTIVFETNTNFNKLDTHARNLLCVDRNYGTPRVDGTPQSSALSPIAAVHKLEVSLRKYPRNFAYAA